MEFVFLPDATLANQRSIDFAATLIRMPMRQKPRPQQYGG